MKGSVDPTTFYAAALPTTGAYVLRNFQNVILVRCKLNLCLRGIIIHFYYRKIKNIYGTLRLIICKDLFLGVGYL